MSGTHAILLSTLVLTTGAPAAALDGYMTYSSVARTRHSSDVLYGERHVVFYRDGHLSEHTVLYTCRNGSAFARKVLTYPDALVPDFLLEDASNGMREGIREEAREGLASGTRTVFYRERSGDPEKSKPVPSVPGLVADAGFDEFVRAHWDSLVSGEALEMRFLLPSRLEDYRFQVQRLRGDSIAGIPAEVFRLRLSGFWGWFLPGIDVYYRSSDRMLLRFDGISDLEDSAGNNYKTTIDFPIEERKAATPQAMLEARQTPLEPCRNGPSK